MSTPSPDALDMAAEWLSQYDEESPEHKECFEVAEWLRNKAAAARQRAAETEAIRQIAKERGVKPSQVRKVLARNRAASA